MPEEVTKDKVNVTKTANFTFETPVNHLQSLQEKHLQTHTRIPTQSERIGC